MSPAQALAGTLQLCPGQPLPTVWSSRPDVAPRLAAGRPAQALPGLLGSVFTLCASAHRLAARLAVAAAQATAAAPAGLTGVTGVTSVTGVTGVTGVIGATADEAQALRLATAREQLARIALDWPRLLPGEHPDTSTPLLHGCPLWPTAGGGASAAAGQGGPATDTWAALADWLHTQWLDQPLTTWLQRLNDDPAGWVQRWCTSARSPLAGLLQRQAAALQALHTRAAALNLLDQPALHLPVLARQMHEDGFCRQPQWQGAQPDTGPWQRQADPLRQPAHNAWMRLTSRLVDLLRLTADADAVWLQAGGLCTGAGAGVAWVESARGLLVHSLRLADDGHSSSPARVADYRVLAPTEWNFHPHGLLAQALVPLHNADDARRLAVAFDPCVDFDVLLPRTPRLLAQEARHA